MTARAASARSEVAGKVRAPEAARALSFAVGRFALAAADCGPDRVALLALVGDLREEQLVEVADSGKLPEARADLLQVLSGRSFAEDPLADFDIELVHRLVDGVRAKDEDDRPVEYARQLSPGMV